jgi:hypothetical protein
MPEIKRLIFWPVNPVIENELPKGNQAASYTATAA